MIVFTTKCSYSNAVWEALAKHIRYIACSEPVTILVEKSSFPQFDTPSGVEVIKYKNTFEAFKIIINLSDKKVFFVNVLDSFKMLFLKPFKYEFYLWHQGIIPEESYLRHKSTLRYFILSFIEMFVLLFTDKLILVSDEAKSFLHKKYRLINLKSSIVVPCTTELKFKVNSDERAFSFVYIGGISPWQCFDQTIKTFLAIKEKIPKATLSVYTLNVDSATQVVKSIVENFVAYDIHISSLKTRNEIEKKLNEHKFGFLLRENLALNNVASPIKFGEYLSCGVSPIISTSLIDYCKLIRKDDCGIIYNGDTQSLIKSLLVFSKTPSDISDSYIKNFDEIKYIKSYADLIK